MKVCAIPLLLLLATVNTANATSLVEIAPVDTFSDSELVFEATIDGGEYLLPEKQDDLPMTRVHATITRVFKGQVDSGAIWMMTPGGHMPDGAWLDVVGAPRFEKGATVLVMTNRRNNSDDTVMVSNWHYGLIVQRKVDSFIFGQDIMGHAVIELPFSGSPASCGITPTMELSVLSKGVSWGEIVSQFEMLASEVPAGFGKPAAHLGGAR